MTLHLTPHQAEYRRLVKMRNRAETIRERIAFEISDRSEYGPYPPSLDRQEERIERFIAAIYKRLESFALFVKMEGENAKLRTANTTLAEALRQMRDRLAKTTLELNAANDLIQMQAEDLARLDIELHDLRGRS